MPYITQQKRDVLDNAIDQLHRALVDLELDDEQNNMQGNLNYSVTRLLQMVYGKTGYQNINDAIGVLQCIMLEHYRKVAAPYEQQKEFENGPIDSEVNPLMTSEVIVDHSAD